MSLWLVQSALPGSPPSPGLKLWLAQMAQILYKPYWCRPSARGHSASLHMHNIIMRVILSDRSDWLSKPGVAPTAVGISRGSVPVQPGLHPVLPLCISISRYICIPYRMVVRCVAKIHQSASPRPAEKRQGDDCTPYLRRTNHGRKCL